MIIGIDPGKTGGWAIVDEGGGLVRCDPMPTLGGKVDARAIAELLREYQAEIAFETPNVVIEEIYTSPSDAVSRKAIEAMRGLFGACGEYLVAVDGNYATMEHMEALRSAYNLCSPHVDGKVKVDGRKGLVSYAKGAGMLHMMALWNWPITEVKPSVWCREMKHGVDKGLSTKDQSIKVAQSFWPAEFNKGGKFYASDRCRKPHDGMVEAALLAEWGRRRMAKGAA